MLLWKRRVEDTRMAAMWIEMVWMDGEREHRRMLTLSSGSTLADALRIAGLQGFAERWQAGGGRMARAGQEIGPGSILRATDRVEFLKPLQVRPGDLRLGRLGRKGGKSVGGRFHRREASPATNPDHLPPMKDNPEVMNPGRGEVAGLPVVDIDPAPGGKGVFECRRAEQVGDL